MTSYNDILAMITAIPAHDGYAPTGAQVPYVVIRPLLADTDNRAINGQAMEWDVQYAIYCCGASVQASYNLALLVISQLDGQRVAGTTLNSSMGYVGAPVEGHYESMVTIQLNQGGI